jgi:hypothetical protein
MSATTTLLHFLATASAGSAIILTLAITSRRSATAPTFGVAITLVGALLNLGRLNHLRLLGGGLLLGGGRGRCLALVVGVVECSEEVGHLELASIGIKEETWSGVLLIER